MEYTQIERPKVGRTFQGMARVTKPNALREVLSVHSSDDAGNKTSGGGGRVCISSTGTEAKSDRIAKGPEAIKSLFQVNGKSQYGDGIVRGIVASATVARPMLEYWTRNFIVGRTGKSEDKL